MHSLKELREQNAAREELSRTAASAGTHRPSLLTSNPLATTPSVSGEISTATTTFPAGRTLAPLARSGESPTGGPGRGGSMDMNPQGTIERGHFNNTEVDLHKISRRRKKKNREQRQHSTEKVEAASAGPALVASETSTGDEDKEVAAENGVVANTAGLITKGSAAVDKQSQSQRDQHAVIGRELHSREGVGADGSSVRGAPPQQKPKKKLTPLAARRARMEQQRREEVDFVTQCHLCLTGDRVHIWYKNNFYAKHVKP